MAMIKCKECGKEFSDKATSCPNCNCPVEAKLFCTECGNEVNVNADVCLNCGTSIKKKNNSSSSNGSMDKTDGLGIAGLVMSVVGFLCCTYLAIPGLIMSIIALVKMNKNGSNKKAIAIVGIVFGALGIVWMFINIITMINGTNSTYNLINEILS